jgi:hypothetical protein
VFLFFARMLHVIFVPQERQRQLEQILNVALAVRALFIAERASFSNVSFDQEPEVLEHRESLMLSFLGRPCPPLPCPAAAVSFVSRASLSISGVQSVFHAAMLGDIGLIQLWTNSGERIRMDEKHPVTGTHSPVPYTQSHSRQCLYNCCSSFVMISTGGTLLHYAAANEHHACVAWLLKHGCKVTPLPSTFPVFPCASFHFFADHRS